jgi:hypothetical protein
MRTMVPATIHNYFALNCVEVKFTIFQHSWLNRSSIIDNLFLLSEGRSTDGRGPSYFSQHTFDHMRRLIHKMKDRAVTRDDLDTSGDAELVDALLLRFVEDLIVEGSITCEPPLKSG